MSYAISLSGTTVSIASPGPRGVGVPTGGTTGQVLKKSSDTDYDFTWGAETAGLSNIVEDTTPQLGGNLDVNGQSIVSASNGDIAITPNGTGSIILDGLTWPSADGTANQVLKTAGDGTLSFGDASVVATTLDLTDTPGSYGTAGEVLALNSGASAFEFVANVASGAYTLDTLGTVAEGSITDVVALTATQYADIGTPDPNTLFVITDGTTSIADSDDVTITSAATNDFLVYDGAWVDKTPAQVRAILDLEIGTDVQAYDADLDALAGLASAADALPYFTGSGTAATTTLSSFGRTLIDDADAATARATLGANDASNLTTGTLAAARLPAITDSYVGHIESVVDGTYYIDVRVPAARTLTSIYFAVDLGVGDSATVDIQEGGVSVLSAAATLTGSTTLEILPTGTTPTISDTALAADSVLTLVISSSVGGEDLRFAVEYTQ